MLTDVSQSLVDARNLYETDDKYIKPSLKRCVSASVKRTESFLPFLNFNCKFKNLLTELQNDALVSVHQLLMQNEKYLYFSL